MHKSMLLLFVASIAAAQQYEILHSFTFQTGDGAYPAGSVVIGKGGHIFGATSSGGTGPCAGGCGTVFELTPPSSPGGAWTETILYSFGVPSGDGVNPNSGLALDNEGALYGTTYHGGTHNRGTVFVLTPPTHPGGPWVETIIYSFTGFRNGWGDYGTAPGSLVFGKNGVLYGSTQQGSSRHGGTVFALLPPPAPGGSWTERTLYSFASSSDGIEPTGRLAIADNGILYGTTAAGGFDLGGTVFSLTPAGPGEPWTETLLYSFGEQFNDGIYPTGGVAIGQNGALYGTTQMLGPPSDVCVPPVVGCGTVFELEPPSAVGEPWTETVIYDFTGIDDDANPVAGVVIGKGRVLYGGTAGTVFQLTPPAAPPGAWIETILHYFTPITDGPQANLAIGPDGVLYGTTVSGGAADLGTVFALRPPDTSID